MPLFVKNKDVTEKTFNKKEALEVKIIDRIALLLTIIGALNWGSVGLFQFDIVGWLFSGADSLISRIIFTLVGVAGLWCISLLFRQRDDV